MKLVENSTRPLSSQGNPKILSGLFAEMGTLNQNGRRYPEDIYESAYEELLPKIKDKRLLGELDHPLEYDEVRLANVSHVITDCRIVEDGGVKKVYGTVELLDTPAGLIGQALVKAGIPIGISSRGIGATRQVRDGVEVTQLKLITYDLVAEPSFAHAILSPDKSRELSDSLHYIESKLPLNESIETASVRDQIHAIRESLIDRKTSPADVVDINRVEIDSLKSLLESSQETIKSDTQIMVDTRNELKRVRESNTKLQEEYEQLLNNMFKLQEEYNTVKENAISPETVAKLEEEIVELRKQLATEKRGMSYAKVSELLEGATTCEEIESRLNSISSLGKRGRTELKVDAILTEGRSENRKLSGLASIVSKV